MFEKIVSNTRENTPMVHTITNYVTVNDCANIILACGGAPIMADDINEVEEITSICQGLVINIGTLNDRTILSMIKAGKKANELGHPVILDPVGAGASKFRTETVFKLLKEVKFTVIRGNYSEIKTVYKGSGTTRGVDADIKDMIEEDNLDEIIVFAKSLSKKTGSIIAITGSIDIVSSAERAFVIRNGHPLMSKITGSGCMLSTVIGAYCGANYEQIFEATAAAVSAMGLCGELAYDVLENRGTATYRTLIIDFMSKMNDSILRGGAQIEVR
ncbi:MAG: hydroxyethylthiazole kinase [Firmicutes bacterium HGW-Firmicutes-7]|nr:MAG: hydroxyethylthiazole kinase [Firmicutes bacterium HGW-Firmicutes-7]